MLDRLSVFLNIRAGEGRLVTLLLVHSFFIGIAKTFTGTAAGALFINTFGAQTLPYVYMGVAVVVSLIGYIYSKIEERLSFTVLLTANLGTVFVVLCALRLLLEFTEAGWPAMALMVWFEVLYMLTNLEFWGLAGRLFNLRQGKRLFGLISSGGVAAGIISGFAMPGLVSLMGTPNLLIVAAGGMVGSLVLLVYIVRLYSSRLPTTTESKQVERPESRQSYADLFKSRYVVLIFALAAISFFSYYFVDNAFYDRAQIRYTDADQLAAFIGSFLAVANVVSFIGRVFISGPFMSRYGLPGGLLSLPVALTTGALLVAVTGTIWGPLALIFWLTTVTKLFDSAIRPSVYRSAGLILYQPLSADQRARVLTAVEGVVQPVAGGITGIFLLFLMKFLGFEAIQLYYILLVILAVWIVIATLLSREYATVLIQAVAKRRLEGDFLSLVDGSSMAILQRGLKSARVGQVIYSLDILEEIEHESLGRFLRRALRHPAPEVRQEALRRIERRGATSALKDVRLNVKYETSVPVQATGLRTLAALGGTDVLEEVEPYLDDPDSRLRQGAMVGLLRSGGIEGVLIAGQRLLELFNSANSAARLFAAQALGEVGISSFYRPLLTLLRDENEDVAVRRAALVAAGKLKSPELWPAVIEAVSSPELSTVAASALVTGGEAVAPQLRAAFARPGQPRQTLIRLARICGRIRCEQVMALLRDMLDYPDGTVRFQVLTSLSLCGYRARLEEVELIREKIRDELTAAAWTLMALVDVGEDEAVGPVNRALRSELEQNRARLFLLLSFIYDSESILRARDMLRMSHVSDEKRAYALEIIDILVSVELKQVLLALFDDSISPDQRLEQLIAVFPQDRLGQRQRLIEIIERPREWLRPWTVACALEAVARLPVTEATPAVVEALSANDPLVRETAVWTLVRRLGDESWQYVAALADDPSPQVARVVQHLRTVRNGAEVMMLSTIEKVFILKTVDIFAETPEEALAEVASILEEVDVEAGDTIFEKGDPGNCMYIIFDGRVRVHDGQRTLGEREDREVFGEMALLDPEPRSASTTALEDTRLLRMDQEPFYELMADRGEVTRGIIRVLIQRIRALSQMLTDEQIPQEEGKPGRPRDALLEGILSRL
jgi:AAA family ATP:ADP antiporter